MILLLDMDETIVDFLTPLMEKYNNINNTNITLDCITEYSLDRFPGMNDYYMEKGFFENLKPFPDAISRIDSLSSLGFTVKIVTNPLGIQQIQDEKLNWINNYLPKLCKKDSIIFTDDKSTIKGDVLFDDAPQYITTFPAIKIVNDRPYNRQLKVPHFRIYNNNWNHFFELVCDLRFKIAKHKIG